MKRSATCRLAMLGCLLIPHAALADDIPGAKGQTYDRIAFSLPSDGQAELSARIMTMNRYANSAGRIKVTDNGAEILRSEPDPAERWNRRFSIKGEGPHDVVLICETVNASPVYCGLTLDGSGGTAGQ